MKRIHKKTEIVDIWPRKEWLLKGSNDILVFGYLVALTAKKRKNNQYKASRGDVLSENALEWNRVHFAQEELAKFLQHKKKIKSSACRSAILRSLKHLDALNYIHIQWGGFARNQYHNNWEIKVFWDDKNKVFLVPQIYEMSRSAEAKSPKVLKQKMESAEANLKSAEAKMPSAEAKIDYAEAKNPTFASALSETYDSTEPQNDQKKGASINIINILTRARAREHNNEVFDGASERTFPSKKNEVALETMQRDPAPDTPPMQVREENVEPRFFRTPKTLPGLTSINHEGLAPRFVYSPPFANIAVDKPAELYSYWDTPGVAENDTLHQNMRALTYELVQHVRTKYNFDMMPFFRAENYRRLICPEIRLDIPLAFGEVDTRLESRFIFTVQDFEKYFHSKYFDRAPDMYHRVLMYLRWAPRGFFWYDETDAPWSPPKMPVALDYSSYTASPVVTESPFHRDPTLAQLRTLIFPPEDNWSKANSVLQRQATWLCAVTAMTPEALEFLFPKFEFNLLHNTKSFQFQQYQKCIKRGSFGKVNLINWFKDFALQYHYKNWNVARVKNSDGRYFLDYVGAECDNAGMTPGVIAYIPTAWGPVREMFFTQRQYDIYEQMRADMLQSKEIGQVSS